MQLGDTDDEFIVPLKHKVDVELNLLTSKDEDYLSQLKENKKRKTLETEPNRSTPHDCLFSQRTLRSKVTASFY